MLTTFQEVNEKGVLDSHCIIGSLDVKALYPPLDIDFTSKIVAEMFLSNKVTVTSFDTKDGAILGP